MARPKKKAKGQKRAQKLRKRATKRKGKAQGTENTGPDQWSDDDELLECDDEWLDDQTALPDRRAIEGLICQQFGQTGASSPLSRAQEMIYGAMEDDDPDERVEIAHEALAICPDCADAHVVLAEEADSLADSLRHYEQGVEAGHRALGSEFEELVGHFWGVLSTRPYMRARAGLADCLWSAGRRDEAVAHYLDMLRLNPHDNQGIRYQLAPRLIETRRTEELSRLIEQFDEPSTQWLFTRALQRYRNEGESRGAKSLLRKAIKANRNVARYLTGQRLVPFDHPPYYSPGSDEEAQLYAVEASGAWKSVPGAIAWLRKVSGVGLSDPEAETAPPNANELGRLPQNPTECWRLDMRLLPGDITLEDDLPLWGVVVISDDESDFVGTEIHQSKPSFRAVWEMLCTFMSEPLIGQPRRPAQVDFYDDRLRKQLDRRLSQLGIKATLSDQADELNARFAELAVRLQTPVDDRPLLELPSEPEAIWQVDCRQMGVWLPDDEGNTVRPWVVLVTSPTSDSIVAHEIMTEQPSLDEVWEVLEKGMRRPATGQPHRPGCVQVRSADQRLTLQRHLSAVQVECDSSQELDHWDFVYSGLARHMEGQRKVAPFVELTGVELEQLGSLFEAAAGYYRAAPWGTAPSDAAIELRCDLAPTRWDAVVIGQNGMTFGLALYEEGKGLNETLEGASTPEAAMMQASALSLTFGEQHELPAADLDAAEQFGWPVAAPEAFPVVFRIRPGEGLTSPSAEDLSLLEAALRAVPEFVASGEKKLSKTVSLCNRTTTVTMEWKSS